MVTVLHTKSYTKIKTIFYLGIQVDDHAYRGSVVISNKPACYLYVTRVSAKLGNVKKDRLAPSQAGFPFLGTAFFKQGEGRLWAEKRRFVEPIAYRLLIYRTSTACQYETITPNRENLLKI